MKFWERFQEDRKEREKFENVHFLFKGSKQTLHRAARAIIPNSFFYQLVYLQIKCKIIILKIIGWVGPMFLALFSMLIVSSLLCLTFYQRIALIMERLKVLQKERRFEYRELFRIEEEKKAPFMKQEVECYLRFLEQQTALVMKRAKLIQQGLFCFMAAISSMVIALFCSLINGAIFDFAMIGFFIFGLLLFFSGAIFVFCELKIILNPVRQESEFVQKLLKDELLKHI